MSMHVLAAVLAESEHEVDEIASFPTQALALGLGAFCVFLIALFVVTRLHVDR